MEMNSIFKGSRRVYNYNYSPSASPSQRRNMKTERLGGTPKHSNASPELRLNLPSTAKLWRKVKSTVFGAKSVLKTRESSTPPMANSKSEFENRLFFEIYKSTAASFELGYTPSVTK